MKINFLTIFLVISNFLIAQRGYQPGYYIDNEGIKTEGLILNQDWRGNPTAFNYKLNEDSQSQRMDISEVGEFGVFGFSKYVRATVEYDTSPSEHQNLSMDAEPLWATGTFFLKVEVEGSATLYSLQSNTLLFFFSTSDNPISQLIYKNYHFLMYPETNFLERRISTNRMFFRQLYRYVNCNNDDISFFSKVEYNTKQLEKVFVRHNNCLGESSIVFSKLSRQKRKLFSLVGSVGINRSSVSTNHPISSAHRADFDPKANFTLKIEAEYIFPFNLNTWSVPFGIFKTNYDADVTEGGHYKRISLNSISAAVGLRRYFFVNKKINIYANAFFVYHPTNPSSSNLLVSEAIGQRYASTFNFSFGLGINLWRVNLEPRFYSLKFHSGGGAGAGAKHNMFSIFAGFRLF